MSMLQIPTAVDRYIFHPIEAAVALMIYSLFKILPIDLASALGGWLGRTIGPRMPISERAVRNLSAAFPEKTPAEIGTIVRGMWDNLCRVVAEYPHLGESTFMMPKGGSRPAAAKPSTYCARTATRAYSFPPTSPIGSSPPSAFPSGGCRWTGSIGKPITG